MKRARRAQQRRRACRNTSLLVLLLAGCVNHGSSSMPLEGITPIPAEPQRLGGDPARGYTALVNEGYVSLGIPWTAFSAVMTPLEERDTLPGRVGESAGVGYSFNVATDQYGLKLATPNCLSCHAKHLNGTLVIGLGRPTHEPARPSGIATDVVGIDLNMRTADELKAFSQWGAHLLGSQEAGAASSFGALAAHRDPKTLAWTDTLMFDPGTPLKGWVDVPPWWRAKKKNGLYYNGAGRGDQVRHMMNMSVVSLVDVAEAERVDAMFFDIAAFIRSIEPPKFAGVVDAALVARGQTVFQDTCTRCHGTYGVDETYPNLLIPADDVGTDPSLANDFWANRDAADWFAASFFGQGDARYEAVKGYVAPPLDGIWATAPFFHNGSVPTLAGVLDSSSRPAQWPMSFEDDDFDAEAVGWKTTGAGAVFDTTQPGYSNAGHTYADGLSTDERRALLEYLKTL